MTSLYIGSGIQFECSNVPYNMEIEKEHAAERFNRVYNPTAHRFADFCMIAWYSLEFR